jgi:lipid A 4'-phosphatase
VRANDALNGRHSSDFANGPSLARGPRPDPIGECYDAVHEPHLALSMPALLRHHLDLLLLSAIGALLVAFPRIDLAIAGLFYNPSDGFYLRENPLVQFVYHSVPWVTRTVVVGLLLFLLAAWTFWRHRAYFLRQRRTALYLLLVMILGPGLLVNTVFKDQWGRARPSQVKEFGGSKQFTRAAIPVRQCEKNCSFVSGHASVGFFFLAFAYVWPRRRTLWLVTGTGLGVGIGLVRIIQGGHFFSDVIFCGIVVYLTARMLHAVMFRPGIESRI